MRCTPGVPRGDGGAAAAAAAAAVAARRAISQIISNSLNSRCVNDNCVGDGESVLWSPWRPSPPCPTLPCPTPRYKSLPVRIQDIFRTSTALVLFKARKQCSTTLVVDVCKANLVSAVADQ